MNSKNLWHIELAAYDINSNLAADPLMTTTHDQKSSHGPIMIVILSSILFNNQLLVLVVEENSKLGAELLYE